MAFSEYMNFNIQERVMLACKRYTKSRLEGAGAAFEITFGILENIWAKESAWGKYLGTFLKVCIIENRTSENRRRQGPGLLDKTWTIISAKHCNPSSYLQ